MTGADALGGRPLRRRATPRKLATTRRLNSGDATSELRQFAKNAPEAEREARQVLETIPCVGPVTIEVVLSELGDVRRFRSQKQVAAYAGLAPGIRESAGRGKQLGITKEGSGLLRWVMIQTAWRLVGKTRRWGLIYETAQAANRRQESHRGHRPPTVGRDGRAVTIGRRYSLASEAQA